MKFNPKKRQITSNEASDERSAGHLYYPDGTIHHFQSNPLDVPGTKSDIVLPAREVEFEELPDGRLVEMIEDPEDPTRKSLVVGRNGRYEIVQSIESRGQLLVPLSSGDSVLQSIIFPRGATAMVGRSDVASPADLMKVISLFIRKRVAASDADIVILTAYIFSTWFIDRFDVAPYLMVLGPPGSGKTTLLNVLALLCRRSLLVGDISSAALYHVCTGIRPTFLLDEAATSVGQSDSALRHFLRIGTTRAAVARKGGIFSAYSAKVLAYPEPPKDLALNSRCAVIQMRSAKPERKDQWDPGVREYAAKLREALLLYRLDSWATIRPSRIPGSEQLPERTQDIVTWLSVATPDPLARACVLARFQPLAEYINLDHDAKIQKLLNSILFMKIHAYVEEGGDASGVASWIMVKDLTDTANAERELRGEKDRLSTETVGHALNRMGIADGGRTNSGARRWLDEPARRQIHLKVKSFGLDSLALKYGPQLENCPLCKEYALEKLLGKASITRQSESTVPADSAHEASTEGTLKQNKNDKAANAAPISRGNNKVS